MEPSRFDSEILPLARAHLDRFVTRAAERMPPAGRMLEIGAQGRTHVQDCFPGWTIESFDLVDTHAPAHVGDLTRHNPGIEDGRFDAIACLEVLEHTVDPFAAVRELRRMLADGGVLLVSSPLNFRIHGPIPDCWRFTEHGWRVLLKDFEILDLDVMETPDRPLFPVKYNIRARADHARAIDPRTLSFAPIQPRP